MLTLTCPYCGVAAEETELAPGGEAHLTRHGPGSSDTDFEGYLFARQNPRGVLFERWRHAFGCGKWFHVARDTAAFCRLLCRWRMVHASPRTYGLGSPRRLA